MEQFLQKLQQYLGSLNIAPENIGEASFIRRLPMFVTAPYEIYTASVLNQKYVLAVSSGNDVPSPEQIAVQKSKLGEVSDLPFANFESITPIKLYKTTRTRIVVPYFSNIFDISCRSDIIT